MTSKNQIQSTVTPGAGAFPKSADIRAPDSQNVGSDLSVTTDLKENTPAISNNSPIIPSTKSQHQPAPAQRPSKAGINPTTHPSDAVRRGLSFGPIKKLVNQQSATQGILKTESKSSLRNMDQRPLSPSIECQDARDIGRLEKEYYADNDEGEDVVEISEDDAREWGSEDETSPLGRPRGRNRDGPGISDRSMSTEGDKPEVTITGPEGEKPASTSKRFSIVRPNTNFDRTISKTPSPSASPFTTDSEEMEDIRHAQKLNISCSRVDSAIPNRVIQTIFRGHFSDMLNESKEGIRRIRNYLIATDLSDEALYALEWTIGTVLRDGDTLYAIYAMDDETGTAKIDAVPIGEGGKAMQDTTAVMEMMTAATKKGPLMSLPSSLSKAAFRPSSRSSSVARSDSEGHAKAGSDRLWALEKLLETCLGFLRMTKLQVRVVIEVIHCKSSRHLITEAVSLR